MPRPLAETHPGYKDMTPEERRILHANENSRRAEILRKEMLNYPRKTDWVNRILKKNANDFFREELEFLYDLQKIAETRAMEAAGVTREMYDAMVIDNSNTYLDSNVAYGRYADAELRADVYEEQLISNGIQPVPPTHAEYQANRPEPKMPPVPEVPQEPFND